MGDEITKQRKLISTMVADRAVLRELLKRSKDKDEEATIRRLQEANARAIDRMNDQLEELLEALNKVELPGFVDPCSDGDDDL